MASIINTNIGSINAQRSLSLSQASMTTSMQRLSSGLRINTAKDDAAGLAISERFTSQIRGLTQAARNANDAISLTQTAEGAMSSISSNLQRMRELAVQSANGTNSASDRAALQNEVSQLSAEIARVATQTQFNGLNLLDGSLSNTAFQVGANGGQTISVSVGSAKTTDLGNNAATTLSTAASISGAVVGGTNNAAVETLTFSGNGVTSSAITTVAGATAKTIANQINGVAAATGIVASAKTTATISGVTVGTATFSVTGTALANISATVTSANDLSSIATAVNNQSGTTGITATSDLLGNLVLTSATGEDIEITTTQATGTGIGGATIAGTGAGVTLNNNTASVGGQITLDAKSAFSVGGATGATLFTATAQASALSTVAAIDVSTVTGATNALKTIDAALATVSDQRAALGAVQNRFESTVQNLQTNTENLSASRSRIQDADFAQETANLSRSQILQQAGTAMVAQANADPKGVLALLR